MNNRGFAVERDRLETAYRTACDTLSAQRRSGEPWQGELSTSALSTATASMALWLTLQARPDRTDLIPLVRSGRDWLAAHQNADGGWGDTELSFSNISTTMLAHAVLSAGSETADWQSEIGRAAAYIETNGGVDAVLSRYGRDRTFSVPILTHCALAGTADWSHVIPLPFELSCLPHRFYKAVRLPVVSYALPALIAIGLARFHARPPRNPLTRLVRSLCRKKSLRVLERIQPENGGFLEAAPLTSFVTMSLVSCGLVDHPVACRGVDFLVDSIRDDGSWPIDTNLATWVTTLSVNALADDLSEEAVEPIRDWLLQQQYRVQHPYTDADPGGWAWTDLPGGVPDADDTPGAILALLQLAGRTGERPGAELLDAIEAGLGWLLTLQNSDGGWPTFCRGWGRMPFDRSSPDISAHVLRSLEAARPYMPGLARRLDRAVERGFTFLTDCQRDDGAWVPLWFGNQNVSDDENPTYGTARVLLAWQGLRDSAEPACRGRKWLCDVQNSDGGWGGDADVSSSVEETALAVEALAGVSEARGVVERGIDWLIVQVECGTWTKSSPIGFYFARLWYFEKLYPLIFTVAALRKTRQAVIEASTE